MLSQQHACKLADMVESDARTVDGQLTAGSLQAAKEELQGSTYLLELPALYRGGVVQRQAQAASQWQGTQY